MALVITRPHSRARLVVAATAPLVSAALVLSGCSGSGSGKASDDPSSPSPSTPSATESASVPAGVELTDPGSQLAFGDTATVDYAIRDQGTVLGIAVSSARQGQLKDFVGFDMSDPLQKNAHYFYVRVVVKNKGEKKLSGVDVPLWGISGTNTLLPPVKFNSAFKKCPTEPLPNNFGPDDTFRTCLVFLSPQKGSLEGISYRPLASFDPIEWHGKVEKPVVKKKKAGKKGKKKAGKG
jgi:hypothetical protein